jgi:FecR protein
MKSYRSALTLLGLAILILSSPLRADEKGYSYARVVRLSFVQGDVQISRSGSSDWEPGIPNMPVQQGFSIGTNNGRAEVEFESGGVMWVGENSVVQFAEMALADGGRITRLTLAQGTASFQVKLNSGDVFEVTSSAFHVSIPNHSKFRVDAFRDGASLSVYEGTATVKDSANVETVGSGKTFANRGAAPAESKLISNPGKDRWDTWVNERSASIASGANQTQSYTYAPVNYGMDDLYSYGNWLDCAGYGFGWQPWNAGLGWSPFFNGYFDYYNGLGWTWISFEPWGWAPYHFGSWAYTPTCGGWMWLPGEYGFWNAAPVIFGRTGRGRISWWPRPVPNPREAIRTVAASATAHGKFADVPVVVGAKGGIGNGFATSVLEPDAREDEVVGAMPEPPGKNGKIVMSEGGWHFSAKPPLAVPTAKNLSALRDGVAFDATEYRFVNGEAASNKLPILANGVREPRGVPHRPEPSSFIFSRDVGSAMLSSGHPAASIASSHEGGFSHGAESAGGSFGAHSGGSSSSSSASAAHSH